MLTNTSNGTRGADFHSSLHTVRGRDARTTRCYGRRRRNLGLTRQLPTLRSGEAHQALADHRPRRRASSFRSSKNFWILFIIRYIRARGAAFVHVNDPSAGSPTETLLRLLLPLDSQVRPSSQRSARAVGRPRRGRSEGLTKPSNR